MKKTLRKRLNIFELQGFVTKTYPEIMYGRKVNEIFNTYSIAQKHKNDYEILIINHLLKFDSNFLTDKKKIKALSYIASFKEAKKIDLGFLYLIEIGDRIKFGKTKDLYSRLSSYKTNSGVNPKLINVWFGVGYSQIETNMKEKFKGKGITLEWFDKKYENILKEEFSCLQVT